MIYGIPDISKLELLKTTHTKYHSGLQHIMVYGYSPEILLLVVYANETNEITEYVFVKKVSCDSIHYDNSHELSFHREDGPAIIHFNKNDGHTISYEFWYDDEGISFEKWIDIVDIPLEEKTYLSLKFQGL